jgi:AcrR family transcriptional regulator
MATPQIRFSSADRREQILDVATGLFAQQGFRGTTTKLIAERAGVTEALIFRHFPSKEELYWKVIERKIDGAAPLERLLANLEEGGNDLDVLCRVAFDLLERRAKDQNLSRLSLYSALEKHELSERFFRNYIANYFAVLERFVREGIAGGRFRKVDPLLAARGFLGMVVYHSWIQELYGGKGIQDFDLLMVSQSLADIWLQGVRTGNGNQRKSKLLAHKAVKKTRARRNGQRISRQGISK